MGQAGGEVAHFGKLAEALGALGLAAEAAGLFVGGQIGHVDRVAGEVRG